MDNNIETSTTVMFSDIKTVEGEREYVVERSEDANCIYKFLSLPEKDCFLSIRAGKRNYIPDRISGKSSSASYYSSSYTDSPVGEIHDYHRSYMDSYPKISIIIEPAVNKTVKQNDSENWLILTAKNGLLSTDTLYLRINTDKFSSLLEEDSKFFKSIFGMKFNIRSRHYGEEGITKLTDLYSSIYYSGCNFIDRDQKNRYLNYKLQTSHPTTREKIFEPQKVDGVSKTYSIIKAWSENLLKSEDYLGKMAYLFAYNGCSRTINNVKFSVVFNKLFQTITSQEEFDNKIKQMAEVLEKETYMYDSRNYLEHLMDSLDDAREIKKAALKRKQTGAFNKIMDDLDFVQIDKEKFPITHEAVFSGTLPLGTFFRKTGDSYFVYNDNWELWEEMLKSYPDVAKEIADQASKRTTYEKDIMSYFYFVLHGLPEYLEKHTGKKWKGIPKLVQSANELEPPKEGASGTAKTRSALTPIVDNEKNEVVIPYVSMRIGGYQTQYCYALDFNVIDKGFSLMGNAVSKSVEKELNGRDDYGLMFYTLTGSSSAQGYPTFLIIFERLDKKTRVHFHRTHPMRSKGGEYNPIHNWTIGCYKWMIGNVNFNRIKAQQGDLAFVSIDSFPEGEVTEVTTYDGHNFETPVQYTPYIKKERQNILGYVQLDQDTKLNHHEHMTRIIPAGTYEIRQCRSWEANPIGIWSLRID